MITFKETENQEIKQMAESLNPAIKINEPVNFIIYKLSDNTEIRIQYILGKILEKYNQMKLHPTLYTSVKELLINGIKANLKKLYFEKNSFDIENITEYKKGTEKFKNELNESLLDSYSDLLIKKEQKVELLFGYSKNGMLIEVINFTPINKYDEQKMREKLKMAMQANDIADYYINYGDDTEGAGIGIALIILLLKGENIDPALFRIGIIDQKTVARIEIPFNDDYTPIRISTNINFDDIC